LSGNSAQGASSAHFGQQFLLAYEPWFGMQFGRWFTGTLACLSLCQEARAEPAPHGPVLAVEGERGSLLWVDDYYGVVEGENRAASFHFDRAVRVPAQGLALRLGWKVDPKGPLGVAAALRIGYAGSFTEHVRIDTGQNEYEFPTRSRWLTVRALAEGQLWDLVTLGAGAGYGWIYRDRSVPPGGRGTQSYVVAFEMRLRLPPGFPVVGYMSLGHEMMGLNPIMAFWEGRWSIGTYSYAGLGIEFDGVGLWDFR
jgi:hypothetical protein